MRQIAVTIAALVHLSASQAVAAPVQGIIETFVGDVYEVVPDPSLATGEDRRWTDYTATVETPDSTNPSGTYMTSGSVDQISGSVTTTSDGSHETTYTSVGRKSVHYDISAAAYYFSNRVCDTGPFGETGDCRTVYGEIEPDPPVTGSVYFEVYALDPRYKGWDGYSVGQIGDTFMPSESVFNLLDTTSNLTDYLIEYFIDGEEVTEPLVFDTPGFSGVTWTSVLRSATFRNTGPCPGDPFGSICDFFNTVNYGDDGPSSTRNRGIFIEGNPVPAVPLPASALLLAGGLCVIGAMRRKRAHA